MHIHFNRKALGYNSKEFETLKNKVGNLRKANNLDHERANETISNIVSIMEVYKDELIKISGRNQSSVNQWCSFETANGTEIIHMMNKYIEEQNTEKRRININEVSKTILLSSKDNLRPTSLVFGKSLAEE